MRGLFYTFSERVSKAAVLGFMETLPKEVASRIAINHSKVDVGYSAFLDALRKESVPVKDFFFYCGGEYEETDEIRFLADTIDSIPFQTRYRLLKTIKSMQSEFEGLPIPMTTTEKILYAGYRNQISQEDKKNYEEKIGMTTEEFQKISKFSFDMLTRLSLAYGISVHYTLGFGDEDLFYGKEVFTDSVIDYYYLLPDYIKPYAVNLIKGA